MKAALSRPVTIALIGNPNTGKSTLFTALCGVRQRVGNYPGVTVEKKLGQMRIAAQDVTLVDLPGTYSLSPRSPDEMIAVDVLLGRRQDVPAIDAILSIVDASNLERNLYLVSQVLELGRPTVLALNMMDVAAERGITIDLPALRDRLGIPVVAIQANCGVGLEDLKATLAKAPESPPPRSPDPFPPAFQEEVEQWQQRATTRGAGLLPRYLVERLILDTTGYLAESGIVGLDPADRDELPRLRQRLASASCPVPAIEAIARYEWIGKLLAGVTRREANRSPRESDRLDRVLTHRVWGTLVFILLMILLFQAVFLVAEPASGAIDLVNGWLARRVEFLLADGPLRSLLVDGMIQGVGGVLVFLPQILTLFLFIGILEDCGYMARAAYLMDKVMSRAGLSGKSFIPLLSSFACAIPGIMAARVIEDRRDRLTTILVAPLMSCSARLPVYTMLIAAFIPNRTYLGGLIGLHGLTMAAMYAIGVLAAILVALVLKNSILKGSTPPFVMELPNYKWPSARMVVQRMLERGWSFVRRAGTLILAVSVLVWAAAYFPRDAAAVPESLARRQVELQRLLETETDADGSALPNDPSRRAEHAEWKRELARVEAEIRAAHLANSWLGRVGRKIEPVVRPLGWDWRIGCAAIASFPAREVVVATLGVIYELSDESGGESGDGDGDFQNERLQRALARATWDGTDRPVFTVPTALSLMVFFALCAQCASTLVIMQRETNSWRWPLFTFVYMTTLAYLAAMATYQIGSRL